MGARRIITVVVVAGLAMLAASCGPPPVPGDSGPVPACPARQRFVIETTDQAEAPIVRAISDNGQWLVTSLTVGGAVQLRLREVAAADPGVVIGSIPDAPLEGHPVAVSDDGNKVVWEVVSLDGDRVERTFHRWDRSTGTIHPLQAPDAGHTIPSGLSPDGKVATWTSGLPNQMAAYTESLTDDVWTPPDVDVVESALVAEALGFDPSSSHQLWNFVASPDGRWWAILAKDYGNGTPTRLARWDVVNDELTVLRDGSFSFVDLKVSDDGSILTNEYPKPFTLEIPGIQITALDGTVRTLQANPPLGFPGGDGQPESRVLSATPDLRSVAFTEMSALPPTAQVVVSRCL